MYMFLYLFLHLGWSSKARTRVHHGRTQFGPRLRCARAWGCEALPAEGEVLGVGRLVGGERAVKQATSWCTVWCCSLGAWECRSCLHTLIGRTCSLPIGQFKKERAVLFWPSLGGYSPSCFHSCDISFVCCFLIVSYHVSLCMSIWQKGEQTRYDFQIFTIYMEHMCTIVSWCLLYPYDLLVSLWVHDLPKYFLKNGSSKHEKNERHGGCTNYYQPQ